IAMPDIQEVGEPEQNKEELGAWREKNMEKSPSSGVQIKTVRVANFRSLVDVEVPLGKLTTLVGSNNAGKTSFLDAVFIAIGTGRRQVSQEDIYIGADEAVPPRDRSAYIDILSRPVNEAGETLDVF